MSEKKIFPVKLSEEEKTIIAEYAEERGMKLSEYIRAASMQQFGSETKPELDVDEIDSGYLTTLLKKFPSADDFYLALANKAGVRSPQDVADWLETKKVEHPMAGWTIVHIGSSEDVYTGNTYRGVQLVRGKQFRAFNEELNPEIVLPLFDGNEPLYKIGDTL